MLDGSDDLLIADQATEKRRRALPGGFSIGRSDVKPPYVSNVSVKSIARGGILGSTFVISANAGETASYGKAQKLGTPVARRLNAGAQWPILPTDERLGRLMSEVLSELERSDDLIDRELARTLRIYQTIRAARGKTRSLGYEPRDIRQHGAVGVIERRIRKKSGGFDEVPAHDSYEAIVLKYTDRFAADVVEIARTRIDEEENILSPTADLRDLELKAQRLLLREQLPSPKGNLLPQKVAISTTAFLRDPAVVAHVRRRASGHCEACGTPAPFKKVNSEDYLEVHHLRTLAEGGSDTVQNAVALCPNCHRAMHYASDAADLTTGIYARVLGLISE